MKKLFSYLILALVLVGCGKDNPSAPASAASPKAAKAVSCKVFDIGASMSVIPDLDLISPAAVVEMDSMNFLSVDENTPFAQFVGTDAEHITKAFAMSCETTFTVENAGKHQFKLTSDDGSKLYINGLTVITNDGPHGATTKTANPNLAKGTYTIRVDYFENYGPKVLNLTVKKPASPVVTF